MRLRKLKYPIAIFTPHEVLSGRGAELHSPRRWDRNIGEYIQSGVYDDAEIIDSSGRRFVVERIFLSKPTLFSQFVSIFLIAGGTSGLFDVDMELVEIGACTKDQFCSRIIELLDEHPEWRVTETDRKDLTELFAESQNLKDAINAVSVFDDPSAEIKYARSTKVVFV